jgi:NTE family protein
MGQRFSFRSLATYMNHSMARSLFAFSFLTALLSANLSFAQEAKEPKPERSSAKVALVLSGGGARGAAHVGVLKVLERERVPIDCIVGTSFGAIVGGLYAIGYHASEIEQILQQQEWNKIFSDTPDRKLAPLTERKSSRYQGQLAFRGLNLELPTGLYGGQKLIEIFNFFTTDRLLAADYDFDRLTIPFRAVATNLLDGKAYIFKEGRMTEALRASIALPLIFTPVEKDGMLLVDGGLVDNLPTDIARELGADFIIAVDVTSPLLKKEQIRTFLNVMDQTISLMMQQSIESNRKLANLILQPSLGEFSTGDYGRLLQMIPLGAREAEAHLSEIKNLIPGTSKQAEKTQAGKHENRVIESLSFQGLKAVKESQLAAEIKTKPGDLLNTKVLHDDLGRLYSSRLFDSVDYRLDKTGIDRYRLTYLMKEAPLNTLGGGIRYDRDYKLVALAEFTARQLFGSPSSLTFNSIFGGVENHSATLRYVPTSLSFLFAEPKIYASRRERLDIRAGALVDKFIDKRTGVSLMVGGTILRSLEIAGGYRYDRVNIGGGTVPYQQLGTERLAGLTLRLNRDTLDDQDFPQSGAYLNLQFDRRDKSLASDFTYSKLRASLDHYFTLSTKSTAHLSAAAGYSWNSIPYYDRFFLGGYNFSEGGSQRLLGFNRDEIAASRMAVVGVDFRRLVFSQPLSFVRRAYATAFYNGIAFSDRLEAPYHSKVLHGAGIGFALDTMLGPLRIAGGWGEGGRRRFYLSLGPSF